jgi:hypothetical protein
MQLIISNIFLQIKYSLTFSVKMQGDFCGGKNVGMRWKYGLICSTRALFYFSFIQSSVHIIHFSTLLQITLLLSSVANWHCLFWLLLSLLSVSKNFTSSSATSCSAFSCSSGLWTADPMSGWQCGLHQPWERCHMLFNPQAALEEVANYAIGFLSVCWVSLLCNNADMISPKITFCRTVPDIWSYQLPGLFYEVHSTQYKQLDTCNII